MRTRISELNGIDNACTQVELCGTRISELNGIDNACSSRLNCAVLESRS